MTPTGIRKLLVSVPMSLALAVPLLLASPAQAAPVASAPVASAPVASAPVAKTGLVTSTAGRVGTDDKSSRSMPRAGAPAASQAYARAYISKRYGWGAGQYSCLKSLWNRESNWRYWVSNPNGKYHGIPQTSSREWSRDGYTRAQYMRSPQIQIQVGARYIKSRYGSPCAAWSFWRGHHWY